MRKIICLVLTIIMIFSGLLFLTGCERKSNGEKSYVEMNVEDILGLVRDRENVTGEEYAKIIDTFRNVKINDDLTLSENITEKAIEQLGSRAKPKLDSYIEILLNSDSEQVRGYGISLITSLTGVSEKNMALAKKLIANEKSEFVLYQATKALSNEIKNSPEVKDFIFRMAKHDNPIIRQAAASSIGNSWTEGVEGAVDEIITLMSDKDANVKKTACRNSGKLYDEKIIEPLVSILNDPEQAEFHGDAVEGLCYLWYDYPFFKHTSEKAYNATMDYFKKTPRTDKVPAWTAFSGFKTTSTQDSFKEWKEKATYFNIEDIYNTMAEIIKDENANYLARTSAIDIIKNHCGEEKFNAVGDIINGLTDSKAAIIKSSYESKKKSN